MHDCMQSYADYVVLLLETKTVRGELSTAKGRRTWTDAQTLHLLPYTRSSPAKSAPAR